MSDIEVFQFPVTGQHVRTVIIDGEPWFVARDVAGVLGYSNGRRDVARHTTERQRREYRIGTPSGEQTATVINEPGVYRLVMRSNLPAAEQFQDWIAEEVLPAIRQTGRFEVAAERPMTELEMAQRYVLALKREDVLKAQVAELEPDAARARQTMDADGLCLVGSLAKRFGIKQKALREFLYAEGLLIRGGNRHNEPMARYVESGHFELKSRLVDVDPDRPPVEKSTTFITPKGEALIWKRLYDAGYVTSRTMPSQQLQFSLPPGAA